MTVTDIQPSEEWRLLVRAHQQLKRYSFEDPVAKEIEEYFEKMPHLNISDLSKVIRGRND